MGGVGPDNIKTSPLQNLLNFNWSGSHSAPRKSEEMDLHKDTAYSGIPQRFRPALQHIELSCLDINFYNRRCDEIPERFGAGAEASGQQLRRREPWQNAVCYPINFAASLWATSWQLNANDATEL
jgi:hypothetical protein